LQYALGKNFVLTSDPFTAAGSFLEEVRFFKEYGYDFVKDGNFWKAIK
jgi:hypothetical protein